MMNDKLRKNILVAARKRFAHYSYGKTTMAEIAKDSGTSVGNLYRFFESKEAIAKAGAELSLREKAEFAEAAAGNGNATERLRAYLMARLTYLHRFVSKTPHMHEIVQLISTTHKELLQHYEDRSIAFMTEIIRQGVDAGEFHRGDAGLLAARVYCAMSRFNMPLCMAMPLEQLKSELDGVLELLLKGLEIREGA